MAAEKEVLANWQLQHVLKIHEPVN